MTDEPDQSMGSGESRELEELLAGESDPHADYVEQVMSLYEASERNYRAAMTAGHVVNGLSDSTNY